MPSIEEQAAAATATLAQMTADWNARPDVQLAKARERAGVMGNGHDTFGGMAADREVARLQKQVEQAGTAVEPIYLTDQQRVDHALTGVSDHLGANVTSGDQVPLGDFNGAVGDLVRHGSRPEAIKSFLQTGHVANEGEDRATQIAAAQEWLARLMRNEGGLRDKLFAGDAEVKTQFDAFAMYAPAVHERDEAYDRVAAGMPAW